MTSKDKKIQEIKNQICKLKKELIILEKENDKISQKVNYSENMKNEKYFEKQWTYKVLIWASLIVIAIGILAISAVGFSAFIANPMGIMGAFFAVPMLGLGVGIPTFITASFMMVSNFFKTKLNKKTKGKKINDIKNNKEQKINDKLQNNLNYKNTNLNVQEINSLDLQNQPSTSGYKPSSSKM